MIPPGQPGQTGPSSGLVGQEFIISAWPCEECYNKCGVMTARRRCRRFRNGGCYNKWGAMTARRGCRRCIRSGGCYNNADQWQAAGDAAPEMRIFMASSHISVLDHVPGPGLSDRGPAALVWQLSMNRSCRGQYGKIECLRKYDLAAWSVSWLRHPDTLPLPRQSRQPRPSIR